MKGRKRALERAAEFSRKNDPIGWFEVLYREAEEGKSTVPWADYHPTPHLISFWMHYPQQTTGKSALVAGCGLGAAAEQLAGRGFCTTAFDISETGIRNARKRFPNSRVDDQTADLLDPLAPWHGQFDLVFEANTLQVLPAAFVLRPREISLRFSARAAIKCGHVPPIEKTNEFVAPDRAAPLSF